MLEEPALIHTMPYEVGRLYPPFLQLENHLVSRHKSPAIIHLRMPISHPNDTASNLTELPKQIAALLYHVMQQVQTCPHNPDLQLAHNLSQQALLCIYKLSYLD